MGFFSELKSDLSQAAKTIIPEEGEDAQILGTDNTGETASREKSEAEVKRDLNEMLDHLDEIKIEDPVAKEEPASEEEPADGDETAAEPEIEKAKEPEPDEKDELDLGDIAVSEPEPEISREEVPTEETVADLASTLESTVSTATVQESASPEPETKKTNYNNGGFEKMDIQQQTPTDETASITEGMKITGNLETTGSLELIGSITGNVTCLGKLNVTGEIEGDSKAAEIYAEAARITGEVRSQGSVKIGQSTVVIGNIFATSAVIAGAVKGDIDVPGPVVLDTTAIVMGNIKSQSVQINNGAVIEGNCSQSYAEVNPSAFFEGLKGNK